MPLFSYLTNWVGPFYKLAMFIWPSSLKCFNWIIDCFLFPVCRGLKIVSVNICLSLRVQGLLHFI
jgi:hypothetical protein